VKTFFWTGPSKATALIAMHSHSMANATLPMRVSDIRLLLTHDDSAEL